MLQDPGAEACFCEVPDSGHCVTTAERRATMGPIACHIGADRIDL